MTADPALAADRDMIVCDNLVRIFSTTGVEVVALQGLDLRVGRGEMVAIVGASGSGKSTLLNILGGLDAPTAGRAVVDGVDLGRLSRTTRTRYRRETVGMIWQQTARNLLPHLDLRSNVELPMVLANRADRRRRAAELLDLVGLSGLAARVPGEVSGGEQQRAAIAVALANEPAVLLADEPTGELDSATSAAVFELLRSVNRQTGTSIVAVTHDPLVADHVSRTVRIRDGRTSTETVRRTERSDTGDHRVVAEEFAVLDRAGRLQLPRAHIQKLGLVDRVRLRLEEDHVGLWPAGGQAATSAATVAAVGGAPASGDRQASASDAGPAGLDVMAVDLGRDFPSGGGIVRALADVSLRVAPGELLAVRGRSGAGKTTLLSLLGGVDRPTSGRVEVGGHDLAGLSPDELLEFRRRTVGYVFQGFGLLPILTAAENVELPLRLAGMEAPARAELVRGLLDLVGMGPRAAHRPSELSGGEQQRVAIARALAARPHVLLADEPTGQLDSETGLVIMSLIRRIATESGVTTIVATHDPAMLGVADRVVELHDGRLAEGG
jgi:ABC-type lipoprotein export system ATPase subunit